jgi:hypothetical protein
LDGEKSPSSVANFILKYLLILNNIYYYCKGKYFLSKKGS